MPTFLDPALNTKDWFVALYAHVVATGFPSESTPTPAFANAASTTVWAIPVISALRSVSTASSSSTNGGRDE